MGSSCPVAPPVSFDAADYGTALVWLDAQDDSTITTVSDRVSLWTSKGTVSTGFAQGTDSARPVYSATGFKSARPGLVFDSLSGLQSTTTISTSSEYTVFFVLDIASFPATSYWLDSLSGRLIFGSYASRQIFHRAAATAISPAVATESNVFAFVLKTGDATHYVDGVTNGTGLTYAPRAISGNTMLGGVHNSPATNPFLGTMSEVIIYSGVLASETVDAVNTALQEKWGLV